MRLRHNIVIYPCSPYWAPLQHSQGRYYPPIFCIEGVRENNIHKTFSISTTFLLKVEGDEITYFHNPTQIDTLCGKNETFQKVKISSIKCLKFCKLILKPNFFFNKNFCKLIPNGQKRVKNETSDAEFLLVSGGRPFLYPDKVITNYHTELHQIVSINKAINQKGVLVP